MNRRIAVSFWHGFRGFYESDDLTYAASIAYYGLLSLLLVLSLLGLPCLHAIRRREKLAGKTTVGLSPAAIRDPQFE